MKKLHLSFSVSDITPFSYMTPLQQILTAYRAISQTEREKGTYFEELIRTYFRNEPRFADLYSDVWLYADWAKEIGSSAPPIELRHLWLKRY